MGLAVRIIPTLLAKGTRLVKGRQFSADRVVGHVQQAATVHQTRGVDELIVLDVTASKEGRGPDCEAVERLTAACFMPITVGGGVRSCNDVAALLHAGADKVSVKTAWDADPGLLWELSGRFGCQAIVAAVDTDDHATAILRAAQAECMGAGEILLTSIMREGTMQGYDTEMIKHVCDTVSIPVIAHGGCSGPDDMLAAIKAGASAVAAGALFQFTDHTPRSCAEWLADQGVEVRL